MTQEEKQLLLKDLCSRLPYGVMCRMSGGGFETIEDKLTAIGLFQFVEEGLECVPYLRPMSSMTEDEKKEFIKYAGYDIEESINGRHYEYYLKDYGVGSIEKPVANYDSIDWLNAKQFDYRGLIPMGLALEAPEGMYNTKTE